MHFSNKTKVYNKKGSKEANIEGIHYSTDIYEEVPKDKLCQHNIMLSESYHELCLGRLRVATTNSLTQSYLLWDMKSRI